jgi:hypothetical protein
MQAQLSAQQAVLEPPVPVQATPQTAQGRDGGVGMRPSAVPVTPGRTPGRCACGGIIGPTGECSACRARRLGAQGGGDRDADRGLDQVLAWIGTDSGLEERVAALVAPLALGVDGSWLGRQLGSGSKLAPGVQREMEDAFGVDFAHVRIHTDPRARATARRVNAEAFSVGPHVVFGDHAYSPDTREGRLLLRHELAHVVQQRGVTGIPNGVIRLAQPTEHSEREARAVAGADSPNRAVRVTLGSVGVAQVNRTSLCEIGCDAVAWGATAALVAAVAVGCTGASVVSFGGLAIPCTAAIIGAAALGAVDAVMWSAILKQAICGIPITTHTPQQQASAAPTTTPGAESEGAGAAPAAATATA